MKKNGQLILTVLSLSLVLILSRVSSADVSLDTAGGIDGDSSSVTVASNSNMVLLSFSVGGNFNTADACTWNGSPMTLSNAVHDTAFDDAYVCYDIDPDTGAHTLDCSLVNETGMSWISIYDANQTGPEDEVADSVGPGDTSPSVSVSTSATSMAFGGFKLDRAASAPEAGAGLTGLTTDATAGAAYGIGVTDFGFTSVQSNGTKLFAVVSWAEAAGGAPARRVIFIN